MQNLDTSNTKIAIVGLGYVGLPLAVEFGKKYPTVGFDISVKRIELLETGVDSTGEVSEAELKESKNLIFTSSEELISDCNVFIITVPTPIDSAKKPNLDAVRNATRMVGGILKKNCTIIYESTVYPGVTEDECVPLLESESGLVLNEDFFVGYSPERINPGDKEHKLVDIVKVTSGSCERAATYINQLYTSIIRAGTYPAPSIKVAEAAKVIENTQRDLNIALVNELSLIFEKLGVDTEDVLKAAGSKWNFLPFRPGLVGGHCIGVDPYYLTHKAQEVGYHPDVILAGRRINDEMATKLGDRIVRLMMEKKIQVVDSKILIMGLAFKANCGDIRNTKVVDMIKVFRDCHAVVHVFDPRVDKKEAMDSYSIDMLDEINDRDYDAVVLAVAHDEFKEIPTDEFNSYLRTNNVIFDVQYMLSAKDSTGRL